MTLVPVIPSEGGVSLAPVSHSEVGVSSISANPSEGIAFMRISSSG